MDSPSNHLREGGLAVYRHPDTGEQVMVKICVLGSFCRLSVVEDTKTKRRFTVSNEYMTPVVVTLPEAV